MINFQQRVAAIILLLYCALLVTAEEGQTKDLVAEEEAEELERGHRRRRRKQQLQQQAAGPCGGGFGRTFSEKLFGWNSPGYSSTYVSAPVMNYFIGCGVPAAPVAPIVPFPPVLPPPQPSFGGHQHHHHHGHGGGGGFGGGGFNGPVYNQQPYYPYQSSGGYNQPSFDQYQPLNQGGYSQRPNRPVQMVVSAAASGLGTALADYISGGSRPKKTHRHVTKTVNQLFKPLYNLF